MYLAPLKHLCPLEISGSTIDKDQCELLLPTWTSVIHLRWQGHACGYNTDSLTHTEETMLSQLSSTAPPKM